MKINKTREVSDYIYSLSDINDLNLSLSDMFLSIVGRNDISSKEEIETFSKSFKQSVEDIYYSKVLEFWDIDPEVEDNKETLETYVRPSFKCLSLEEFKSNPYYKNIKIKDIKDNHYALVNDKYRTYELFASDDIWVDENYVEHTSIGFFKEDVSFVALNKDGVTWMSVNPNEIKTMEAQIKEATGKVIVFGLGLGYFPYMISLKEDVKEITIIENDENIINIFNKYLLPQFENKNKIKILKADALSVIKTPLTYDYAFVDLWHNAEDGLNLYITFKKNEHIHKVSKWGYWLERSFYALLRRAMFSLLIEQLEGKNESYYKKADTEFDKVVNRLYEHTKNLSVSSIREINDLLKDQKLLELYK